MLDNMTKDAVLNWSDIYTEVFESYIDKKFMLSYALLPIPLLGLVYTGHAVIALKNGVTLSASDLESIPKINAMDIFEFKHISKPKDLQLPELMRLFEILDLPEGLIRSEPSREMGVEKLIAKAQEVVGFAVKAKARLDGDFSLWGEPLIAAHLVSKYKDAVKHVSEMLGNFQARFNTVAKLMASMAKPPQSKHSTQ